MTNKETLNDYFNAFSSQDIDTLSKLFSDNVTLVDWVSFSEGKDEVLEANKKIFEGIETILATPIEFYSIGEYAYAIKVSILVNGEEKLDVIDVINFDDDGLITSITAFKYED